MLRARQDREVVGDEGEAVARLEYNICASLGCGSLRSQVDDESDRIVAVSHHGPGASPVHGRTGAADHSYTRQGSESCFGVKRKVR